MEGRLALHTLYRRVPGLELAIDDIPPPPSFFTIGPLSIPVA